MNSNLNMQQLPEPFLLHFSYLKEAQEYLIVFEKITENVHITSSIVTGIPDISISSYYELLNVLNNSGRLGGSVG